MFSVVYNRTRTQYIVRASFGEIVPTRSAQDPLAWAKARRLAEALNRVYAQSEPESVVYAYGADEHHFADGSPRPSARDWFEEERAKALARGADVAESVKP